MRRVVVLRPEPGASETLARARALGLNAISIPLFEVAPAGWTLPDAAAFDGLLLTSANAVRHGGEQVKRLRQLPVYAVGEATAAAARDAGFHIAAVGDSGVGALLDSIAPGLRLLHLCGEHRAEISDRQEVMSVVVYRSRPLERVDVAGLSGTVALIHSPRAGRRLAELVEDRASVAIAAISPAAAGAAGDGWATVAAAERPTDDALLALARRLCNKPEP